LVVIGIWQKNVVVLMVDYFLFGPDLS